MKKTIFLDASALSKSSCFLRLYRTVVEGWKEETKNNDTEYGSAFAKFKEHLVKTDGDIIDSMRVGQEYFRTINPNIKQSKEHLNVGHLTLTCQRFIDKYGARMEKDNFQIFRNKEGKPLVESKFSLPYYVDEYCQIVLSGTMDGFGKFSNGCVSIGDDKTTSSWNKEQYLRQYKMSPQLMFYRLMINILAEKLPPGNHYQQVLEQTTVGAFVTVAFLKKDEQTEFVRSPVYFYSDQQLTEYRHILDLTVKRLARAYYWAHVSEAKNLSELYREGMVNGSCQTPYGFCQFFNVCSAPESATESLLKAHFIQKPYEPLKFR